MCFLKIYNMEHDIVDVQSHWLKEQIQMVRRLYAACFTPAHRSVHYRWKQAIFKDLMWSKILFKCFTRVCSGKINIYVMLVPALPHLPSCVTV